MTEIAGRAEGIDGSIPVKVDASGRLIIAGGGGSGGGGPDVDDNPDTGTITAVNSATTMNGVQLLAANDARYGFTVVNTDANDLYVGLGSGNISATSYTFKVAPGADRTVTGFTGVVKGIWAADGSGQAVLTEYT